MSSKHPSLVAVGARIRALRVAAGYAQEEFAGVIDMDRSHYGHVERGSFNLSVLTLLRIAKGLKIKPADLLPDGLERPISPTASVRPRRRVKNASRE